METSQLADRADEAAVRRWQVQLRSFIKILIVILGLSFLVLSALELAWLHKEIGNPPAEPAILSGSHETPAEDNWYEYLAGLEVYSIQRRYHQANVLLEGRIMMGYLGFLTGMVLSLIGAIFVFGRLREASTEVGGKNSAGEFSITSSSPGLILVTLGTVMMLATMLAPKSDIQVKDGAIYVMGSNDSDGEDMVVGASGSMDRDRDGIPDDLDKCPDQAEDFDGYQDTDGCHDMDNDGDGIVDMQDQCPGQSEDLDGFEDPDGCPDLDNDKDGILDKDDKCPNASETFNGFEDTDGCPDTR